LIVLNPIKRDQLLNGHVYLNSAKSATNGWITLCFSLCDLKTGLI